MRVIPIGRGGERWVMTSHRTRTHAVGRPSLQQVRRRVPLAVGASVGTVLLLAGCASGPASAPTTSAPTTATSTGDATSATAEIAIYNFMFVPATLTVKPGTEVTVVNRDNVAHTVTSASGGFNTGDIAPGKSAVVTAPAHAGDFTYICNIHQYMTGKLVVS